MNTKILEITIKSAQIKKIGEAQGKEDVNLLGFELYYPRENVSKLLTLKKVNLKPNIKKTFGSAKYRDKIIFKEAIRGKFELYVYAVNQNNPSHFEKLLLNGLKGAFSAGMSALTGGIGNVLLAGFANGGQSFLVDQIKIEDGGSFKIGEDSKILNTETLTNQELIINLEAPKDIPKLRHQSPDDIPNLLTRHNENAPYISAGYKNGTIKLDLKTYDIT